MAVSLANRTLDMDAEVSSPAPNVVYDGAPRPRQEATGVRYTRAMDAFLTIRKSYSTGGSEFDAMKRFTDPRLLVIDEMQERSDTPFEDRVLVNIIDNRYGRMLDTVLIANSTPEQFAKAVGPSIYSRASEVGAVVECNWPSFRERTEKEEEQ
jgi:DNA replication protein DnaC